MPAMWVKTLYDFIQIYGDSVATGLDFKTVAENVSGIDFTDFFNQWYFGEGYPTFSVIWSQQADTVWLNSIQTTSTIVTPLFRTPIEFRLSYSGGSQTVRLNQQTNDTTFKIVIPNTVTGITVDPNNWILNQIGAIVQADNLFLKSFLEGPFDNQTGLMSSDLNPDFLPENQPFNQPPWEYTGTEHCTGFPTDVTDWVLVELRDTTEASLATQATVIKRFAALLLSNGRIVKADGSSMLQITDTVEDGLFVVIHHRNHLSVMSADSLVSINGVYAFDFTSGSSQYYGGTNSCRELMPGIWGMISGDADANGAVEDADKSSVWSAEAGKMGYISSDMNLDRNTNNADKNELWLPNIGKGTMVP